MADNFGYAPTGRDDDHQQSRVQKRKSGALSIDRSKISSPLSLTGITISHPTSEAFAFIGRKPLTDLQRTAVALDALGISTMPVPHLSEWRAMRTEKKSPYLFREFRNTRLHRCGAVCARLGRVCHPRFETLFVDCNLAVWAGRMSRDMLCLDADSEMSFKQMGMWLLDHGIPQRGWFSRRGGSFIMRCREGEVANISGEQGGLVGFPDVECHGSACYHLIPPSVNPANVTRPYVWLPGSDPLSWEPLMGDWLPEVSIDQLRELGINLLREKQNEVKRPRKSRTDIGRTWGQFLSEPNRRRIMVGFDKGKRSNGLFRVACDLAAAVVHFDIDKGEAFDVLEECAARCRPPYESDRLMNIWARAQKLDPEPAREYYTGSLHLQPASGWGKVLQWITAWPWKGQAGHTDRAVALACCERMRIEGTVFRATTREVAEIANVTRHTAESSLRRLSGHQKGDMNTSPIILKYVGEDPTTASKGNHGASRWSFLDPLPTLPTGQEKGTNGCVSGPLITPGGGNNGQYLQPTSPLDLMPRGDAEQDAAKAIGGVAWSVWCWLRESGSAPSVSALAKALGRNKGTISRAVKSLIKVSLANRASDGSILFASRSLEIVAADKNKAGCAAARRERHQYERERMLTIRLFYARVRLSCKTRSIRVEMGLGGWLYEYEIDYDEQDWLDLQRGNRHIRKAREAIKEAREATTRIKDEEQPHAIDQSGKIEPE